MKKILIASDSYKESLTGLEVADAIGNGFKRVYKDIEIKKVAMADGGEGTIDTLMDNKDLKKIKVKVNDPLFRKIESYYAYDEKNETAIIEMALASGLELLKEEEKNPLITSSFGTGELIKDALLKGAKKIIVTIGGSATNDAGIGIASALGVKFYDKSNKELEPIGMNLVNIKSIDDSDLINTEGIDFEVACDVENPMYGLNGAAHIYAKQKGASENEIKKLDEGLMNIGNIYDKKKNISKQKGSGAAGAIGAGLIYFCNASLKSGVKLVIEYLNLEEMMIDVDLVITGEGMMDYQSVNGKTPIGVSLLCNKLNIPTIAICGSIGNDARQTYNFGIDAFYSPIQKPLTLENAMLNTKENLESIAENIARTIEIGQRIKK